MKGVITSRIDEKKIRDKHNIVRNKLIDIIVKNMCYIGEAAVKKAREMGDYNDITGNLRSSIGYVVLVDGEVRNGGLCEPVNIAAGTRKVKTKRKDKNGNLYESFVNVKVGGDGSAGVAAGEALLSKLKTEYPYGVVLILCAGMEYAAFVENVRHKHVLIDAELEAQRLIEKLLGKMIMPK